MAIVRRDKTLAGYNGNLEHVKVQDAGVDVEVTNGVFVIPGGFIEAGEREARNAVFADDTNRASDEILMVHAPEVSYDESPSVKLRDFKNEAGKIVRAYRFYVGDIITLTENLFDTSQGAIAVGSEVAPFANGKLAVYDLALTSQTNESNIVFEVIENSGDELDSTLNAWAVRVKKVN